MKKYYSLTQNDGVLDLDIYGDITSVPWNKGDVSAVDLAEQLKNADVEQINVYISSYGGEVQTGLAIYNALKRHKAKVTTYCDGFACSIASVIFMSGDERVMNEASLLMIHNAWTGAVGNAEELRKQAEDLDKITQASVEAYKAHSSLEEEEIKALMDAETWILPEEALEYGFATTISKTENVHASQNAFAKLVEIVKAYQAAEKTDDDEEPEEKEVEETEKNQEKEDISDETKDKEKTENDEEKTNQHLIGFFNAIAKM